MLPFSLVILDPSHRTSRSFAKGWGCTHQKGTAYTLLTERNADFALTLVEAFEREGRSVSSELVALSQKSKRYGGGGGRKKNSKVGLGFGNQGEDSTHRSSANYYGPAATTQQPLKKKSRWG